MTTIGAKSVVKVVEILLIEDNPGDVRLTQECLRKSVITNHLTVIEDGETAFALLHRLGQYSSSPRPDLILLDLNLPKKDGRELLADIKSDEKLKRIPVIVLTSSDAEADIAMAYSLHANCYITKPIIFEDYIRIINAISEFWLGIVTLADR